VRSLLLDPFQAPYLQRALIEAVLLGVLAGVVGVHVVLRQLSFVADTFTHTVFPGLAVAFALGGSLFLGALAAGLVSAVTFTLLDRNRRITSDSALAVVLTSFFALGVVVISRTDRYTSDLTGLLFGRILTVDRAQIVETAVVLVVVLAVVAATHKELVLRAFSPASAEALGYRVGLIDLLTNVLVVLVVVAAARSVGTLLTVALLIVPAATAKLVCRSVARMYLVAAAAGALGGWLGLAASYEASITYDLRLASGATVVLALVAIFVLVLVARRLAGLVAHRHHRGAPDDKPAEPAVAA
jgi:manganese/iron transport system permease protein